MSNFKEGDVVEIKRRLHGHGRVLRVQRGIVVRVERGGDLRVRLRGPARITVTVYQCDAKLYEDTPQAAAQRSRAATKEYAEGLQAFVLLHASRLTVKEHQFRNGPRVWYGVRELTSSAHTLRRRGLAHFTASRGRGSVAWDGLSATGDGRRWLEEIVYSAAPSAMGGADA